VLACFLGPDGGPREGAIRLGPEKLHTQHQDAVEEPVPPDPFPEEPDNHDIIGALRRKASRKLSGLFSRPIPIPHARSSSAFSLTESPAHLASSPRADRPRAFSRTSRADGSAYGYSGGYRSRLASTVAMGARKGSMTSSLRRRRGSVNTNAQASEGTELNFAQRLLMANENAVTNIADLWVAAAMNVDNENPFISDSEEDVMSEPESIEGDTPQAGGEEAVASTPASGRISDSPDLPSTATPTTRRPSRVAFSPRIGSRWPSPGPSTPARRTSLPHGQDSPRRFSSSVPAIFSHAGVRVPPAVIDAQQLLARSEETPRGEALSPILESRATTNVEHLVESQPEKQPSLTSQLPLMIIAQYGVLALHSTTHDQIFMSYLVTCVLAP
jgi:hypothetical protein